MSDVQNLLCVVVRTLPNVIVFSVNLIVPEGLDTCTKTLSLFSVNLIVPEGFLHFTYLVFTVVMLPSSEVLTLAHIFHTWVSGISIRQQM